MENNILKLCASKGFLLDKEALETLSKLKEDVILEILRNFNIKEKIITRKTLDKYNYNIKKLLNNIENLKKSENIVKILSPIKFSSKKREVKDFIRNFYSRYVTIKEILESKNLENLSSIRKINNKNGIYTIIAVVLDKKITKNKNLLIKVEDLTGNSAVLINNRNLSLFSQAKNLLLDDIVVFRVSVSNKMLFVNEIIYPDTILEKKRYCNSDEYVAFSGDMHVGSKMFLEKEFLRFVAWLNGKIGDDKQKEIAKKVKYLFLTGDNIDGVGQYSKQEDFLDIKGCREQYEKVWDVLRKIREDVQIIICPGQHDAVWIGEPQLPIPKKWAEGLYQMKNLHLVSNPALIEINGGFKVLMYHGASINRFINEMPEIRINFGHRSPTRVVREMLKRRHLSPIYGLMDYIPFTDNDPMVIDIVPDIIATADQHRAEISSYNNILMIASSCWQSITPFEKKVGNVPVPCRVPLFNLKTRETKIINFSNEQIKDADSPLDVFQNRETKNET